MCCNIQLLAEFSAMTEYEFPCFDSKNLRINNDRCYYQINLVTEILYSIRIGLPFMCAHAVVICHRIITSMPVSHLSTRSPRRTVCNELQWCFSSFLTVESIRILMFKFKCYTFILSRFWKKETSLFALHSVTYSSNYSNNYDNLIIHVLSTMISSVDNMDPRNFPTTLRSV